MHGFKGFENIRKEPDLVLALQQREDSGGSDFFCRLSMILLAAGYGAHSKALLFLAPCWR